MNVVAGKSRRAEPRTVFLIVAIVLVGILALRQVHRLTAESMWVADAALAPGTRIGPGHLRLVRERKQAVPRDAIAGREAIEGQVLYQPKAAGRPFFPRDFVRPAKPVPTPLSTLVPEGRVLTTLEISQTSVPYPQLRMGDRLEVVAVDDSNARVVASNAFLIGSLSPGVRPAPAAKKSRLGIEASPPVRQKRGAGGLALILALLPEDVLPVAEAQGSEASITVVLHGRHEVEEGELLDLDAGGPRVVELLVGDRREEVSFPL